jgi:hypothetical protein
VYAIATVQRIARTFIGLTPWAGCPNILAQSHVPVKDVLVKDVLKAVPRLDQRYGVNVPSVPGLPPVCSRQRFRKGWWDPL